MHAQSTEAIVAPKTCPFCESPDIITTSKTMNVSTYWRCTGCGEIWNVDRLQYGQRPPFGRFR